uniref:Metal-nicotianamine transporter YSL5 n=1 Tax=Cucumis melo TaxID=3656 RepID=A0A9I9CDV9_CUCME
MEEEGVDNRAVKRLDSERDPNQKNRQRFGSRSGVLSIEEFFEDQEVPSWRKQLTFRAFFVSFWLSILFSFIVMKLNLTTGIIPSLNVSAGLLGFFFVKSWTKFLERSGLLKQPFTRQENTVIQTCVVASSGIAFSGGFGTYLFGMSERIAHKASGSRDFKDPSLGWMIGFLFVVSFLGLFSVVPLRKIMIIDFKLTYPSGTATAHLINSFHTPRGAALAKKQVRLLGRFYFDFSATYIGVGMICPHIINVSVLVGGIISWGIMWPLIEEKKGQWYSEKLRSDDLSGLEGYKVFIAIAIILGDGLYNFFKVLTRTLSGLFDQLQRRRESEDFSTENSSRSELSYDDARRKQLFLKDQIPIWFAIGGYVVIAVVSINTLPHIFPQLKWYYIFVIYIFAPVLAFCNAYGCGLTDWSLASTYGKLAIFTIGAWAGPSRGGIIAGLSACGVMMNIVSTASDLTQDFKTGYLTLASPRSMFVSQVVGTTMGCIISPCVFWLFYKAFDDLGLPTGEYPAPNAVLFRNMSVLGVEGASSLPKNCLTLCYIFFATSILINLIKDLIPKKWARFIPLPMAMAIPFYIGPYFAIDMSLGSLILFVWQKLNRTKAEAFGPAVASGLICGDGIWTLPNSILALAGVKAPICMKFLSRSTNARVDKFLGS